jgi:hypothetical protein
MNLFVQLFTYLFIYLFIHSFINEIVLDEQQSLYQANKKILSIT